MLVQAAELNCQVQTSVVTETTLLERVLLLRNAILCSYCQKLGFEVNSCSRVVVGTYSYTNYMGPSKGSSRISIYISHKALYIDK